MSDWATGMFWSAFWMTAICLPLMSRMWLVCDSTMSLGSGSDAGSGRKRNAARIVVATPMGTATDDTTATPKVRNRLRIRARAWQPRRLVPVRPPSVDALARELAVTGLPHPLLVDVARRAIADDDVASARERAAALARTMLQPVVNATGVLLHTNLGRAPVDVHVPARFPNLELDLSPARRASRHGHAAALLARVADAEAALVVNNGAAAVLLVLAALARDRDVAVSRGELVEIGGGFRVPEVRAQSGARLREVGTTNRTRLADYASSGADVVLKVHPSNY